MNGLAKLLGLIVQCATTHFQMQSSLMRIGGRAEEDMVAFIQHALS